MFFPSQQHPFNLLEIIPQHQSIKQRWKFTPRFFDIALADILEDGVEQVYPRQLKLRSLNVLKYY
jgi:hypothetical protein